MSNSIHFLITGGTIDSFYDGTADTVKPSKSSVIPEYINSLKLYDKAVFTTVCMKDSRSLTKIDLGNILKAVEKSPYKKIVITHGTYTMPDTARFLKAKMKRKDKVIILTGSMIPLNGFNFSDAPFNLGYSVAKLFESKPGIYICMNGQLFSPEEVAKRISEGRFYSIFNK